MRNRILVLILLILSGMGIYALDRIATGRFNNVAIGGWDPVSYHLSSGPVKGDKNISYLWQGAEWHFASEENRRRFIADPQEFAPQYGGYCANGLSDQHVIRGNPEIYYLSEEGLFFFFSQRGRDSWIRTPEAKKARADAFWSLQTKE